MHRVTEPLPVSPATANRAGWCGLAAFTLFVVVGLITRVATAPAAAAAGTVIALAAGVPLFVWRRWTVGLAAVAAAGVVVVGNGKSSDVGWFALIVLAAWCAVSSGNVVGLICWAAAVSVLGGEWLWAQRDPGWAPWAAGLTASVLFSLMIRHQLVLLGRLRAAQADLAERSRAEERARIARELHDIIAHSLTVSLLHVTSARLALQVDPADAARALEEAENLGRQSLAEVRTTMGLLRSEGADGSTLPAPGLAQVTELVDGFRRAGADITVSMGGPLGDVPATTQSAVYRIVQEALTNASKHAPGARVTLTVSASSGAIQLHVHSAGPAGAGTGMGVVNMQERAVAVGGSCSAGPDEDGWLVRASLPVAAVPSGHTS